MTPILHRGDIIHVALPPGAGDMLEQSYQGRGIEVATSIEYHGLISPEVISVIRPVPSQQATCRTCMQPVRSQHSGAGTWWEHVYPGNANHEVRLFG